MPSPLKISPEVKEQFKLAAKNPRKWWRGADLPEEELRPWEGGILFFSSMLNRFMDGFADIRDRYFVGMAEGRVTPGMRAVGDVINITLDAFTDPPIGVHMDRRNYAENTLRNIMRASATIQPLLILLLCFHFGLSPLQRITLWTVSGVFNDIVGTANGVSTRKIWAGITPFTEQRGTLRLFQRLGENLGGLATGIPVIFMGLREILGITDYQIMIVGAIVFAPVTIFARWLPSYAKQRVDFQVKVKGEGETDEHDLSFRERFTIVKHNRWFMMWLGINMFRLLTPRTDFMFMYRFLIPTFTIAGRTFGGEILYTLKNIVFGLPGFLVAPFGVQATRFFRGPMNFIRCHVAVNLITNLSIFLVGFHSFPRLLFLWTMEMFQGIMNSWSPISHTMMEFEMFDYVEWKTGYRSEGITESVNGVINKFIRENANSIIGNAVLQWTGYLGWDIPADQQPERFINSIFPLLHLSPAIGEVIAIFFVLLYRTPKDPKEVEQDLIERRALAAAAKQAAQELEEELATK